MAPLRFGDIEIRPDERKLVIGGQPVVVGARAFDLLLWLVHHRDRVVTKDELLKAVWPTLVVEESNLTVHVAALRKLLGAQAIATIPGRGYRFVAPAGARSAASEAESTDKPSLAVLPFANLSGDAAQEHFVDGVVDDLTSALSRVRRFFVIARTSSFTYKGRAVDVPQVGRELGVRYVLEGSFRMAGERLRIGVQLVETTAGRHLWTQRFEGSRNDIFALQDEITAQVVAAIEPRLVLAEVERARTKPTTNLHAYDLCLKALPLVFTGMSPGNVEIALGLFKQALAADPDYAYAKSLYAWAHTVAKANGWMSRQQALAAIPFARDAHMDHRDDPTTLALAGHSLAMIGHHLDEAVHALDTALALNPSSIAALRASGWVRSYVGDHEHAIKHLQRAMALNPLDPEIGYALSGLAFAQLGGGRPEEALVLARRALLAQPGFAPSYGAMMWALGATGRWDEARAFVPQFLAHRPGFRWKAWRVESPWNDESVKDTVAGIYERAGLPA